MDAMFLEGCLALEGIKTCCPIKAADVTFSNLFESFGGSEAAMLVVMWSLWS
jgi:hypothetical protein